MKQLVIEPIGGLANRMRVIASAMELCRRHNWGLVCVWDVNPDLGASYDDLFVRGELTHWYHHVRLVNVNESCSFLRKLKNQLLCHLIWNNGQVDQYIRDRKIEQWLLDAFHSHHCVYVHTCEELLRMEDFGMFRPTVAIQSKVITESNMIGLHIRRTDNIQSIQQSPISLFKDAISKELSQDKNAKFYLATDDAEVLDEFIHDFPGKIISIPKTYGRDNRQAMQDAVAELYCLANTARIYGSYWSSYSDIASRIGQNELIICAKQK